MRIRSQVLGSGVNVRMGAKALIESNSFVNAKKAIVTNQNGGEEGFVVQTDNLVCDPLFLFAVSLDEFCSSTIHLSRSPKKALLISLTLTLRIPLQV